MLKNTALVARRTLHNGVQKRFVSNHGFQKVLKKIFAVCLPTSPQYTSRVGGSMPNAGLSEVYPGVPEGKEVQAGPSTASVTTLPNGLRVASITSPNPSPIVSVGVYVTSGSRHETRATAGTTHFLKHLAFNSTQSRPAIQLVRDIETLGATLTSTAAREHLSFESEVPAENATQMISILGDLLHPRVAYHEVERSKPIIEEEVSHLSSDPVNSLFEALHREAFRNRGLGQPLVAPSYNIEHINHDKLAEHAQSHYTPRNTVVVASGLPHAQLVELVQRSFEGLAQRGEIPKGEASKYTGGEASCPNGGNTHAALAFEGLAANQKDSVALAVLQHVLGGGSRLSRDGPGVGLQSRLNTKLVGPHENVQSALAFNLPYSDTGLFGIYVQASENASKALEVLVGEVVSVLKSLSAEELARAKQSLKAEVFSEKRKCKLHFVAQQVKPPLIPFLFSPMLTSFVGTCWWIHNFNPRTTSSYCGCSYTR